VVLLLMAVQTVIEFMIVVQLFLWLRDARATYEQPRYRLTVLLLLVVAEMLAMISMHQWAR